MPAAVIAVAALIIGLLVATNGKNDNQGSGEIFLQPIGEDGPDPFGPSAANPSPSSTIAPTTPVTLGRGSGGGPPLTAPVFPPGSTGSSGTSGALAITPRSGGTPGLYGGTQDQASCNKQQMIDFLAANPGKARAWAEVVGVPVEEVTSYINGLTPVLLRSDTRVTNHGFVNGRPKPLQVILQAGTAVLVDNHGLPRARCACGNPLIPPQPVPSTPTYTGPPWTGFSPANVTVVNASTTVINTITVINVTNGVPFGIPTGPGPYTPVSIPGTGLPGGGGGPTGPGIGGTTTTTGSTTPVVGSSWRLREVRFVNVLGQPEYQVVRQPSVSGGEVVLTIRDTGTFCTGGGTEQVRLSWTIERDVSVIRNGDQPIPVSMAAAKAGATGGCGAGSRIAALVNVSVAGSKGDGSLPAGTFTRPVDQERFSGSGAFAAGSNEQAQPPSASSTVTVDGKASDPTKPVAWFAAKIAGPGVQLYAMYIYEQA